MSQEPSNEETQDESAEEYRNRQQSLRGISFENLEIHKWCDETHRKIVSLGNPSRGGFGHVYRLEVENEQGDRELLAVKSVKTDEFDAPACDAISRMIREMKHLGYVYENLGEVDKKHLCRPIDDFYGANVFPFLVMEFIEGRELADAIELVTQFTPDAAVKIMLPIVRVIGRMHNLGVRHRDLSPRNIMLEGHDFSTGDCRPVLIDLGLSWSENDTQLTRSSVGFGNAYYMSPEQGTRSEALTDATDVYSLGAILYHLVTGQVPFGRELRYSDRVAEKDRRPPSEPIELVGSVDPRLNEIIYGCLQPKVHDRKYGSGQDLARDLEHYLEDKPADGLSLSAVTFEQALNSVLKEDATIQRVVEEMPEVDTNEIEPFKPSAEIASGVELLLQDPKLINDPHAIMLDEPHWNDDPLHFELMSTDYATLETLRQSGHPPFVLSANCLIFCEESRQVILHRRSNKSRTYPGKLHTFGGAYMPPKVIPGRDDGKSLAAAAEREIHEECGLSVQIDPTKPVIMSSELRTGFIQAMAFVNPVAQWQVRAAKRHINWEGKVNTCKFSALKDLLLNSTDWTPTGWAHVMCWLALGVPYLSGDVRFGTLTARQLFDEVMSHAQNIEFPPANPRINE